MKYRNKKGRFVTKKHHSMQGKLQWYTLVGGMLWAITLGISHQPDTIEWARPAEASVDPAICELNSIECDGEIDAIIAKIPHESEITTEHIKYAYKRAIENGVDGDTLMHIAWCESMLYNVQSNLHYTFSDPSRGITIGEQERSYGWFMVHQPDHNITPEQALNVEWSIDWAIEQIKSNNYPWYGYNKDTDLCRNEVPEYWN